MTSRIRGLDGLAARLAARILPPVVEQVSASAASALAGAIAEETGAAADITAEAGRRVVRLADPVFGDRVRGTAEALGDPVLSRLILETTRRR